MIDNGEDLPDPDLGSVRGLRLDPLDDIDGHQRRRAVEGGGDRAHQGRQKPGGDDPLEPGRDEADEQHGQGLVGVRPDDVAEEDIAEHAGEDQDEDGQDLEQPGEERPVLGVLLRPRAEDPLDDGLVGAPVPDPEDGVAEEDGVPVEPCRAAGLQHAQLVGLDRRLELRQGVDAVGRQGQDGENRHDDRAEDQDHGLDGLRDDHRLEPAQDGIDPGDDGNDDDRRHDVDAEELPEDRRPGVEAHPDVDEERGQDGHEGQHDPGPRAVALLQELGQGRDAALEIERARRPGRGG